MSDPDLIAEELEEIRAKELTMVRTDMQARSRQTDALQQFDALWWKNRDQRLLDLVVDVMVTERALSLAEATAVVIDHLCALPISAIEAKVDAYRQIAPW